MNSLATPTETGAFLQMIEYRTEHPEEIRAIIDHWLAAIGTARTARWYITTADRDRPDTFAQLVEFPDHAAAMRNSDHPATAGFAARLRQLCPDGATFRNLDVIEVRRM